MAKTQALTKDFYEWRQYPGPDAIITFRWADNLSDFIPSDRPFTFLDAGCGSGQHTAGLLLSFPQSKGIGIDLSESSLNNARALLKSKNINHRAKFCQRSFCEPLDFNISFDLILAPGSIHHSERPDLAFQYLSKCLSPNGLFAGMLYSKRSHYRRLQIKEMLEILAKEMNLSTEEDFLQKRTLFEAYREKYPEFLDMTLREVFREFKKLAGNIKSKLLLRKRPVRSYFDTLDKDILFADKYLTPIDTAFDSSDIRTFLESANLELIHMFGLGRQDISFLPLKWQMVFNKLDPWEKIRILELIDPHPISFSFLAQKQNEI